MVYKMPMQDGSAVPGAESGMTDSRQGSPSLNWGTNAPRLNPFWNTIWGSDRSKKCLNHLSGVPSTAFSILILLLAALPYKPKPYHKFPLSSCKSVFIGGGLFHTLTCFMVFWQSKQSIKIFWEGCGGKKNTTKHFLMHSEAEEMVLHPPFPVKPSSTCGAFCCAVCAFRALLSSTGSESPCRSRGTPLQRSAIRVSKGSVQ